ncbi:MAG: hypothetical protein FJ167_15330 [Gammaproteobacteria bacterium]|nr:hypothetical protein [Gammaproteobacteria bacterium]
MKPLLLALSLLLPLSTLNAQDKEKKSDVVPAKEATSTSASTPAAQKARSPRREWQWRFLLPFTSGRHDDR